MKRGDLVVVALQGDDGKPRPALVVQSDLFNETHASMTVAPITSTIADTPLFRVKELAGWVARQSSADRSEKALAELRQHGLVR